MLMSRETGPLVDVLVKFLPALASPPDIPAVHDPVTICELSVGVDIVD
jgi:hypothetical protein